MADGYAYRFLVTAPGGGENRDNHPTGAVHLLDGRCAADCQGADGRPDSPPGRERGDAAPGGGFLADHAGGEPEPVLRSAAPVFHQHPVCGGQCVCLGPGAVSGVVTRGRYKFTNANRGGRRVHDLQRDFGIPVGSLASTGVPLTQNFPGRDSLDQIIRKMYTMAGERNGRRYLIRFSGDGPWRWWRSHPPPAWRSLKPWE